MLPGFCVPSGQSAAGSYHLSNSNSVSGDPITLYLHAAIFSSARDRYGLRKPGSIRTDTQPAREGCASRKIRASELSENRVFSSTVLDLIICCFRKSVRAVMERGAGTAVPTADTDLDSETCAAAQTAGVRHPRGQTRDPRSIRCERER
jgi:hypothetical protein